jgi:hypothetical protein
MDTTQIFDIVDEITTIHALRKIIEEIFFHDETIRSEIKYCDDSLARRI